MLAQVVFYDKVLLYSLACAEAFRKYVEVVWAECYDRESVVLLQDSPCDRYMFTSSRPGLCLC